MQWHPAMLFAKNERANLSRAERNQLAALVDVLVGTWLEKLSDEQGIREHPTRPE